MSQKTNLHALVFARTNIFQMADMWPMLVEERIPGTPRPWLQTRLGGRGQRRDVEDSSFLIHGVTAPVRIDVLDTMAETLSWLEESATTVAQVLGVDRPRHVGGVSDDPIRLFDFLHQHWEAVEDDHPDLANTLAVGLSEHAEKIARTLGLALDGKVLPFPCPYCNTARAMVVLRDEVLGLVIACSSGACSPGDSSTHEWRRGKPVWRFSQWENLAGAVSRG